MDPEAAVNFVLKLRIKFSSYLAAKAVGQLWELQNVCHLIKESSSHFLCGSHLLAGEGRKAAADSSLLVAFPPDPSHPGFGERPGEGSGGFQRGSARRKTAGFLGLCFERNSLVIPF